MTVVEIAPDGSGVSGFAYDKSGAWRSLTPRDREVRSTAKRLLEAMRASTEKDWRVRIIRATQELEIEFEYDHPEKWAIGPDALERIAEAARPKE